jgi:hypothetical protein
MRAFRSVARALAPLLAVDLAFAQSGHMMNNDTWGVGWMGGYGGIWVPILLVVVVAGVVARIVKGRAR